MDTSLLPRPRREWRESIAIPASLFSTWFTSPVEIETLDLSVGGMFLRSELLLEVGERVLVVFTVPGTTHQVMVDASVVRVSHSGTAGMGLAFDKLPRIDAMVLRTALARHRGVTASVFRSDGGFRC